MENIKWPVVEIIPGEKIHLIKGKECVLREVNGRPYYEIIENGVNSGTMMSCGGNKAIIPFGIMHKYRAKDYTLDEIKHTRFLWSSVHEGKTVFQVVLNGDIKRMDVENSTKIDPFFRTVIKHCISEHFDDAICWFEPYERVKWRTVLEVDKKRKFLKQCIKAARGSLMQYYLNEILSKVDASPRHELSVDLASIMEIKP